MGVVAINPAKKFTFWILVSSFLINHSFSQELLKGQTKTKLLLNAYTQDGNEGSQIYDNSNDEEVEVIEPMLFIEHQISETTNLSGNFIVDAFSSASDTKLDGKTGTSGAGIGWQSRYSGSLGISNDHHPWKWGASLGYSGEWDYRSKNVGLFGERSLAEDNFKIGLSLNAYFDQTKLFDIDKQSAITWKDRNIYSATLSLSQLLTVKDSISGGYTYVVQKGALENISNTVLASGSRTAEILPNKRARHSLFTTYAHAWSYDLANHMELMYYKDDWDLSAWSVGPSMLFSFLDDKAFLKGSYRFYSQKKSKYFAKSFNSAQTAMTSDSDLGGFHSDRFGVHFSYDFSESVFNQFFERFEYTLSYFHYERSNQLHYDLVQTSLGVTF